MSLCVLNYNYYNFFQYLFLDIIAYFEMESQCVWSVHSNRFGQHKNGVGG